MKYTKYLFQYILSIIGFLIFKLLGAKLSSNVSGKIFEKIGPFFRSEDLIDTNLRRALPYISSNDLKEIKRLMWNNYGRTFAEYMFIKDFRFGKLTSNINIQGQEILNEIKQNNKPVVFISGHLANFELMAMCLERSGINLSAIYRPLNNIFLNQIMENIRKKYICKNQIKKGKAGLRELIFLIKKNFSTALMIDQRVSQGILSDFFKKKALTTTIPAQLVKKFNVPIVPVYIERVNDIKFKIKIEKPLNFSKNASIQIITDELNHVLEKMILKKPEHWIWSHNRWK